MKKNMQRSLDRKYYDNSDMARLFKVTPRTLQRWRDNGIVPYKKLGGKIYYLAVKVDELMCDEGDEMSEFYED